MMNDLTKLRYIVIIWCSLLSLLTFYSIHIGSKNYGVATFDLKGTLTKFMDQSADIAKDLPANTKDKALKAMSKRFSIALKKSIDGYSKEKSLMIIPKRLVLSENSNDITAEIQSEISEHMSQHGSNSVNGV